MFIHWKSLKAAYLTSKNNWSYINSWYVKKNVFITPKWGASGFPIMFPWAISLSCYIPEKMWGFSYSKEEEKNRGKPQNSQKAINKMSLNAYLSIITLNIKDIEWLNSKIIIIIIIPMNMLPIKDILQT